jgi:tetratricopeptide (TPR) repeat protein
VTYDFFQLVTRKTTLLTHLGRHQRAVEEAQKFLAHSQETGRTPRPVALNLVAYMRSLGKVDLRKSLEEIDESLAGISPAKRDAARLDTRGFILYQMGRYDEAIKDFDVALPQVERTIAALRASRPKRLKQSLDFRTLELEDQQELSELAVIYYHRALVLEKLNRWKEANLSRRKAKELLDGREPDESVF